MVLAVVVAVVAVFAITNVVTIVGSKGSIVTPEKASIGNADAIVVLGASVLPDGTPSGILADRLDDGIALYFAGVAPLTARILWMTFVVERPWTISAKTTVPPLAFTMSAPLT